MQGKFLLRLLLFLRLVCHKGWRGEDKAYFLHLFQLRLHGFEGVDGERGGGDGYATLGGQPRFQVVHQSFTGIVYLFRLFHNSSLISPIPSSRRSWLPYDSRCPNLRVVRRACRYRLSCHLLCLASRGLTCCPWFRLRNRHASRHRP